VNLDDLHPDVGIVNVCVGKFNPELVPLFAIEHDNASHSELGRDRRHHLEVDVGGLSEHAKHDCNRQCTTMHRESHGRGFMETMQ
jgi:hypothetical protein